MMASLPKMRTCYIAFVLYCILQSVEVRGYHTQLMQQPQVIPVPQYVQQPQHIPVPQYQQPQLIPIPQYITVPQYITQPQMYYPHSSYYHRPQYFDCYRGMKLDRLISDVEKIQHREDEKGQKILQTSN